jgi:hypothetical protein
MPSTYEPIATTTLGSATNSVTFSSIAGTYTDLLVIVAGTTGTLSGVNVQFNSDTGTNYSRTIIYGTGSTAASGRSSSTNQIGSGTIATSQSICRINVMNYANSTTYKTTLSRSDAASDELLSVVGLWRSTSAITAIKVAADPATTFSTGSTFTLYGIKAA